MTHMRSRAHTHIAHVNSISCSFPLIRSANYYQATGACELSEMDRITLAGATAFQQQDGTHHNFNQRINIK